MNTQHSSWCPLTDSQKVSSITLQIWTREGLRSYLLVLLATGCGVVFFKGVVPDKSTMVLGMAPCW